MKPTRMCRRLTLLLAASFFVLAVERPAPGADRRAEAGKHMTQAGMLLSQEAPDKPWRALKEKQDVFSGDSLVGLPGAVIESANHAVRLTLLTDLDGKSPLPILDSGVILHPAGKADLDFTLTRGRVDVTNLRTDGPAQVVVRFHDQKWDLVLKDPGARVALELYGRWLRGVPFSREPNADQKPASELVVLALKGEATLDHGDKHFLMHAPPGPAYFHWDSQTGADAVVMRLEKLPVWADPSRATTPEGMEVQKRIDRFRERAARLSPDTAMAETLASEDHQLAVTAYGATDNLWELLNCLAEPERANVRNHAVLILRHWIGRCPGQDQKLYEVLVNDKKFPPAVAETIMQLLHSLDEQQLGRPEPYAILIEYLLHDLLPVRQLAQWHLYRIVPAGRDIPYDAAASYADRKKAHDAWKKLVPEGQLPPAVKPSNE